MPCALPLKSRLIPISMSFCFLLVLGAGLLLPGASFADAVIEGQVHLPQRRARTVITQRYEIVAKDGIVSVSPPLAIVYVEGAFPASAKRPVQQVAQKDLAFQPTLLAVQTGTKVEFPNLD